MSQFWLLGLSDCEAQDFPETWYQTHLDRRGVNILTRCFQRESVLWHFIKVRVAMTAARMLVAFCVSILTTCCMSKPQGAEKTY